MAVIAPNPVTHALFQAVPVMQAGALVGYFAFGVNPFLGAAVAGVAFLADQLARALLWANPYGIFDPIKVDSQYTASFSNTLLAGATYAGSTYLATQAAQFLFGIAISFPHVFVIGAFAAIAAPLGSHVYNMATRLQAPEEGLLPV